MKGREGEKGGIEEAGIHSSPCPIRCDAIRCGLLLSMCDNLNHAGRQAPQTDRPTADWHVEHRDNGAPTANGMVAKAEKEIEKEGGGREE